MLRESVMKHYGITQWVDYARGLVPERDALEMRNHLSSGCDECRDLAGFCEDLNGISQEMLARPVPEWLVRGAKAILPSRAVAPVRQPVRVPAELIYDSLLAPAPVGLRAGWQGGWQALYRAGD